MKRLSLIVFLVCLMSSSVFARYYWMQADESEPQYAATDNWMEPNQWDEVPPPGPSTGPPSEFPGVPPLAATLEINMITKAWMSETAHCTINSNVGIYSATSGTGGRISINGTLYVKDGAIIGVNRTGIRNGLRVGSASAGGTSTTGTVEQTAGTVTASNVYLGYGGTMSGAAEGYYVISGGSLIIMDDPVTGGVRMGGLAIASGVNQASTNTTKTMIGKFTVDCSTGSTPTISVTSLTVGGNITSDNPGTSNTGTLEFVLGSISPINCSSLVFLGNDPNSTANLVVTLLDEEVPPPVIVLVKNSSNNAVVGTFDSVTLNGLPGYHVVYNYNAEASTPGTGNDIALIPEPATIALFGLGLLALVRRPRRK